MRIQKSRILNVMMKKEDRVEEKCEEQRDSEVQRASPPPAP